MPGLAYAFAIALGLMAGFGSAMIVMRRGAVAVQDGWSVNRLTGSVDADPVTRARVALTGLFALNRSQGIYFTRSRDDAGRRLDENCRYRVAGAALPGAWWSVTVYAADAFLPHNHDGAFSFDSMHVHPDSAGRWQAIAAPRPVPGATWISTRNAGAFDLTLRLYRPTPAAQADFATIALPHVTRIACGAGA